MSSTSRALGLGCLFLVACGTSSNQPPPTDDTGSQPMDDAAVVDPHPDTGVPVHDASFDAGPYDSQCHMLTFPTEHVADGVENTQCVILDLGNEEPIHVGSLHNILGAGSHHFIVYRASADAVVTPVPFDCTPFVDTLSSNSGSPLMITQRSDEQLVLPPGVAYTLPAHQLIRLELHYINATGAALDVAPTTELCPISAADYVYDADFLFIGDPDVNVPAHQTATLGPIFYQLDSHFADANFFAITGHEHQLGTNVYVETGPGAAGPFASVYDVSNFSWREPETVRPTVPFQIPRGGGFNFRCDWDNPTDTSVTFGESANDEMCFFWAYYYPAHPNAAHVCVHTDRVPGGYDICCPGAALCDQLLSHL